MEGVTGVVKGKEHFDSWRSSTSQPNNG